MKLQSFTVSVSISKSDWKYDMIVDDAEVQRYFIGVLFFKTNTIIIH